MKQKILPKFFGAISAKKGVFYEAYRFEKKGVCLA